MPCLRTPPWSMIALVGVACAGMWWAGLGAGWAALLAAVWLGSLAVNAGRGPPAQDAEPPPRPIADGGEGNRLDATIEVLSHPVLLLDGARITMANQAARAVLGEHIAGQDARVALRFPDAVRLLDAGDHATASVIGLTGPRSAWRLVRRNIAGTRWLIELFDQTAEANIGRAHTDFVANASHELRTPLAAIIGYAETLADEVTVIDAPTGKRFVRTMQREAARMLALVEDLMTLSRVEAEKHDQPSGQVDLSRLAARVVAEVASLAGKERAKLVMNAPGLVVPGDAGQLEQLLRNLIDNALKYGAPDQPVEISLERLANRRARLSVRDHGPGIAPEHLPHLTRRFYRVDAGRSRASGGTGLGLAIVKHIVERHRGELDIVSTAGEGTTAAVSLPTVG